MTDPLGVLSLRPSGREGASYLSCTDPMSLWSPTAFLFEVRNAALSDESESRSTSGFDDGAFLATNDIKFRGCARGFEVTSGTQASA